jgi:hypothetical protein
MENPRLIYATGLRARPALLVRGSSRRITIMRFRPANIRVIHRRDSRLGHLRCGVPSKIKNRRREKNALRNQTLLSPTSQFDRVVPYQIYTSALDFESEFLKPFNDLFERRSGWRGDPSKTQSAIRLAGRCARLSESARSPDIVQRL